MALQRIVTRWAALAVVLATASQLRLGPLPLGPGELLLASWVIFITFLLLGGVRFTRGRTFWVVSTYWLIAAVLLALGTLVALATHELSSRTAGHDALALALTAVFSCLVSLHLLSDESGDYHADLARATFCILTVCVGGLLLWAYMGPSSSFIQSWWGSRFRGWAVNPNQMAFAVVAMPFLGWYLLRRSRGLWRKSVYGLAIAVHIVAGLATDSDALRVAWLATLGGIGLWLWYRAVLRTCRPAIIMYICYLIVPTLMLLAVAGYGEQLLAGARQVSQAIYEKGDQGSIRITHWLHGLSAIAKSPLVGFGPGAYSGPYSSFQDVEAHNSLIDWAASTGILGLFLHLGLWLWCACRAIRSNCFALVAIIFSIVVDSLFGYKLRHPIYWLVLILVFSLAERERRVLASLTSRQASLETAEGLERANRPDAATSPRLCKCPRVVRGAFSARMSVRATSRSARSDLNCYQPRSPGSGLVHVAQPRPAVPTAGVPTRRVKDSSSNGPIGAGWFDALVIWNRSRHRSMQSNKKHLSKLGSII